MRRPYWKKCESACRIHFLADCTIDYWNNTVISPSVCDAVYCGKTIHPTQKVSEQVNRKCPLYTQFFNFQSPIQISDNWPT